MIINNVMHKTMRIHEKMQHENEDNTHNKSLEGKAWIGKNMPWKFPEWGIMMVLVERKLQVQKVGVNLGLNEMKNSF